MGGECGGGPKVQDQMGGAVGNSTVYRSPAIHAGVWMKQEHLVGREGPKTHLPPLRSNSPTQKIWSSLSTMFFLANLQRKEMKAPAAAGVELSIVEESVETCSLRAKHTEEKK